MKFYAKYTSIRLLDYRKVNIFTSAKRKILLYKFGANEKILDKYCMNNYHISLRLACIMILFSSKFMSDLDGRVIINTANKWDKLARIITYGNGIIPGSKILINALNK